MLTRGFADNVRPIRNPWRPNANYAAPTVEHVEALFIEVARSRGAVRLISLLSTPPDIPLAGAPRSSMTLGLLGGRSEDHTPREYTASTYSYPEARSITDVEALYQAHQLGRLYSEWPRDTQEAMQQAIATALRICYQQNPEIALRRLSQNSGQTGRSRHW